MEPSFNPWLSIWTEPRATIRRIVEENPNRNLWLLAAIYGFISLMTNAQSLALGQTNPIAILLLLIAVLSPIWGYLFFSIWSFAIFVIGKLFGGIGTFRAVRAAYAWSCVPFVINLILWIVLAIIFGQKLFMLGSVSQDLSEALMFLMFCILIARLVLAIWSLIIYFNALSEVQGYSILKAIFNVILAAVAIALASWAFWVTGMHLLGPNNQTLKMGFFLISGVKGN